MKSKKNRLYERLNYRTNKLDQIDKNSMEPTGEKLSDVDIFATKIDIDNVSYIKSSINDAFGINYEKTTIPDKHIESFLRQFDSKPSVSASIIDPVFLSIIDGSMRAFKIGSKQGITATRIFNECKNFTYNDNKYTDNKIDRFTEYLNEQSYKEILAGKSNYNGGVFSRAGDNDVKIRDTKKMAERKKEHFGGSDTAEDEYSPGDTICKNNAVAFKKDGMDYSGKERHPDSAEADHVIPCNTICNELKNNKALTGNDIKEILNIDENIAITSRDLNCFKKDKSNSELIEKYGDDFTENQKFAMKQKEHDARKATNIKTNDIVIKNIMHERSVQKLLANDAASAAGHRAIGDVIIVLLKPLYFELTDCFQNGIQRGVGAENFKQSLTLRFKRINNYIITNAAEFLKGSHLNFVKSFVSMLIEGILNCFVGIFKHVARAISEGIRLLMQIMPILSDETKSSSEKGDIILKTFAFSATALAGIGIESLINSFGIPEPWSIILASILSTVLITLVMYSIDKVDIFNTNRQLKKERIRQALDQITQNVDESIQRHLTPGYKMRSDLI